MKNLKAQNKQYLAHEYVNKHWYPMHFSTMAEWLEPAKLQYDGSANVLDHVDGINMIPEQLSFVHEIPDPMLRQSIRDFMINQQFRREYRVKGARKLSSVELVWEGEVLDSPEKNLAELIEQANTFADKRLPVLKALQII